MEPRKHGAPSPATTARRPAPGHRGEIEEREEHADGDHPDDDAERDEDEGLDEAGERFDENLVLLIEEIGHAGKNGPDLTGALTVLDRLADGKVDETSGGDGGGERLAPRERLLGPPSSAT